MGLNANESRRVGVMPRAMRVGARGVAAGVALGAALLTQGCGSTMKTYGYKVVSPCQNDRGTYGIVIDEDRVANVEVLKTNRAGVTTKRLPPLNKVMPEAYWDCGSSLSPNVHGGVPARVINLHFMYISKPGEFANTTVVLDPNKGAE